MARIGWDQVPHVANNIALERFLADLLEIVKAIEIRGDGVKVRSGTASPEGVIEASPGSLFLRTDGGTTTTLYVKTSGTGTTGWTAK
jgi:hypothetical protein